MVAHASEHFLPRDTWKGGLGRSKGEVNRRRHLDEAFFETPHELQTNQKYVCYNCHYEDFVDDNTVYYYLVFGDFVHDEPVGFECPNCGGPLTTTG